ncbi:MAG: sigma-54 dependent transcriptional regulator [Gammaproteobacteria bacterium]
MKILVIDSDCQRQANLEARLTAKGIIITTNLPDAAALVILGQEEHFTKKLLEESVRKPQVLLTESPEIYKQFGKEHIIFLLDQIKSNSDLIDQINTIFNGFSKSYFMPIAVDPSTIAMLNSARKAANSKASILISGETGVGKEVLSQYVHHHSPYAEGPFVAVNCAALPENMIEAILFGHEKGAFTGAINHHLGKFEQAQQGSLLLDEISELPLGLQAKLLRVLQEREVERLGGKKPVPIQVRIIAASNLDLRQQVMKGLFRRDLYYRLNVIPLHCAPLRNRVLDIIPLAEYFLKKYALELEKPIPSLTNAAKRKLTLCKWYGNIREMDNVIQRAIIMTDGNILDEQDIILDENLTEIAVDDNVVDHSDYFSSKLEASEAHVILDMLKETDGCRHQTAEKLNISPRTLRYKIAKLKSVGIDVP